MTITIIVVCIAVLVWLARDYLARAAAGALIQAVRRYCNWRKRVRIITRLNNLDEVYMIRFAIWGWLPGDKPHGWLRRSFPSIYLHRIMQEDPTDLHNHPWHWAMSLILKGGYWEERYCGSNGFVEARMADPSCPRWANWPTVLRLRAPGSLNWLRAGRDYHRIAEVPPGGAWTLFIASSRHGRGWGFLVPGIGFVHHIEHETGRMRSGQPNQQSILHTAKRPIEKGQIVTSEDVEFD